MHGYPLTKLVANRIFNWSIRALFRHGYSDTTNAFKAYRREVIENVAPLLSNHFNLTVELPLKAVVRGYSYAILPISWTNRERGVSKLRLQEMGSRYLFIVLYVFLEHHLSRGDYRRAGANVERLRPAPMRTAARERTAASPGRMTGSGVSAPPMARRARRAGRELIAAVARRPIADRRGRAAGRG